MIYNTSDLKEALINKLSDRVKSIEKEGIRPSLALIRLGDRAADISYEKGLEKSAKLIDLTIKKLVFPEDITTDSLIYEIDVLNKDPQVGGILIFRPLPGGIEEDLVNRSIDPKKDVDCLHPENQLALLLGKKGKVPATALSALIILKDIAKDLSGKRVLIVNRSMVIGKPLCHMLLKENATVTIAHSKTDSLPDLMKTYDYIVLGTGQGRMIDHTYVSPNATVVDCGISFLDGALCGDADTEDIKDIVKWVTPVPGGVGALTNLCLLDSVLEYF